MYTCYTIQGWFIFFMKRRKWRLKDGKDRKWRFWLLTLFQLFAFTDTPGRLVIGIGLICNIISIISAWKMQYRTTWSLSCALENSIPVVIPYLSERSLKNSLFYWQWTRQRQERNGLAPFLVQVDIDRWLFLICFNGLIDNRTVTGSDRIGGRGWLPHLVLRTVPSSR